MYQERSEKYPLSLMKDEESEREDKAKFFEKCVTCTIHRKITHYAELIDKTFSHNEMTMRRILEIDGVFKANSAQKFTISNALSVDKPLQFITKAGDDSVLDGEYIFVESTTSCKHEKIKKDIQKYENIFDKYNFVFDADFIQSKNIHLVIVFDRSLDEKRQIINEVNRAKLLFKSITVFYCDFVELINTWCSPEIPLNSLPTDIFCYVDERVQEMKVMMDLLNQKNSMLTQTTKMLQLDKQISKERIKNMEENFVNRVLKNGQGNWALKTFDNKYLKVRYSF